MRQKSIHQRASMGDGNNFSSIRIMQYCEWHCMIKPKLENKSAWRALNTQAKPCAQNLNKSTAKVYIGCDNQHHSHNPEAALSLTPPLNSCTFASSCMSTILNGEDAVPHKCKQTPPLGANYWPNDDDRWGDWRVKPRQHWQCGDAGNQVRTVRNKARWAMKAQFMQWMTI